MTDPAPGRGRSRNEWFLAPLPVADELPEPVPEEPPPAASEPVVRRPRRGTAAALAAVALLAGLAIVGDGGGGDPESVGKPIVTTTTVRRPATTVGPSTTAAGERVATGPLLPEPTGAALVVVTNSQVLVVELDTGAVRSVAAAGRENYHGAWAVGDVVVVQSSAGVIAVPVRAGEHPVVLTEDHSAGWPAWPVLSDRAGHLWLMGDVGRGLEGREVSVDGHESGRRFALPAVHGGFPTVVVHGGVVVEHLGSLTLYDPDTGEARAIGHGVPLAGSGDTLARISCEVLRCRLQLTSLRTGGGVDVRPPPESDFFPFAPAAFSLDGRWLAVAMSTSPIEPDRVAVVDVATGEVVAVHPSATGHGTPFAFSPDSRWLFLLDGGDVMAHRLGTNETLTLEGLHPGGAIALAVVALGG